MLQSLFLLFYLTIPPINGHLCTETDLDFDGFRYKEQIPHCVRNVTTERKIAICKRDGVDNHDRSDFTVDHIIPLALGGSNSDENLWCQHHSLAVTPLEYKSYTMLDRDEIIQSEAIEMVLAAKFKTK
jgi:5-methylcytosine-specific restriction endonuclease McrA